MINFNLRSLLIPRKMTIRELADISGVGYWSLVHMSQLRYKSIKFQDVQKICDALDITPNELFGYKERVTQ
ncbi:helix-turn-helix domain-containing protein [Companilactobacillus pabuli]|jgi:DNA-binding Xre family transcriptional regulator|uniref:helix-turn-helix domain-containing protein n=1 Tax=Companilactobacillus pabuli TaxID=2714036 RepID=UPI00351639BF